MRKILVIITFLMLFPGFVWSAEVAQNDRATITTLADDDLAPVYDTSATAGRAITWANIWANYLAGKTGTWLTSTIGAAYDTEAELNALFAGKQASNAYLTDIAGLSPSAGDLIYFDGVDFTVINIGANGTYLGVSGGALAFGNPSALSDLDDLPGDTVDDDLIDQVLVAGFSTDGAANPGFTPYDSDAAGADAADRVAGGVHWDMTTTTEDNETSDFDIKAMKDGTLITPIKYDGSDDQVEFGKPIEAKPSFQPDSSGNIAIHVNAINYGTDTGDADIPDGACDDAGDVGNWVCLMTSAADQYSLTSNDASNQFTVSDNASAFTAGNELDVDGTQVCVMCMEIDLWKVTSYMGDAPTDGGAAD